MASFEMTLKLLVDNKTNKVLFAEAGKDFVDLVFGILSLPVSKVVALVSAGEMQTLGSAGRLYKSVADMGTAYLLPSADKRDLLQPMVLPLQDADDRRELLARFKMYTCPALCLTVAVEAKAECPECKLAMATEMALVPPSAAQFGGGGYVKDLVTYMVTDGLEVTPLTSGITLINRFSVDKDVDLAEKFVTVGTDEGLALIQAALRSDTVLSDVFLGGEEEGRSGKTDGCAQPLEPHRPVRGSSRCHQL